MGLETSVYKDGPWRVASCSPTNTNGSSLFAQLTTSKTTFTALIGMIGIITSLYRLFISEYKNAIPLEASTFRTHDLTFDYKYMLFINRRLKIKTKSWFEWLNKGIHFSLLYSAIFSLGPC